MQRNTDYDSYEEVNGVVKYYKNLYDGSRGTRVVGELGELSFEDFLFSNMF